MGTETIEVRMLLGFQGDHYVARSVDLEIVAQDKSKERIIHRFLATYISMYKAYKKKGLNMHDEHPKAPKEILEAFGGAFPTDADEENFDHTLVRPEARVVAGAVPAR